MATNNALNAPIPFAVGKGGTGATTLTDHGFLFGSGTGAITASSAPTNGQLAIGSTGADPVIAALTAGTGITVTNGAGSITIDATVGVAWNNATGDATATVNNGYVINGAGLVTITIPGTAAVGSIIAIAGNSASGWLLQANTGQVVNFGDSPTTTAGSLASTNRYDCVEIVCTTANTNFSVRSSQGNLTVA